MSETDKKFNITLDVIEWHELLKELEYLHCIVNRDKTKSVKLWENIASQLSNKNEVIYGSEKHRKLEPELFKVTEKIKNNQVKQVTILQRIGNFCDYIFLGKGH